MSRPELFQLYQHLMDSQFEFMGRGEFTLAQIYRAVKERFPELCDDGYLCKDNCSQGHNQPEWRHRVRAALDQLKNKPEVAVTKLHHRHWSFGASASVAESDDASFPEGREVIAVHRRKERNRKAVHRKKQSVLAFAGRLCCEVCDFDFQAAYGDLGRGFAECHHRTPLSELQEGSRTRLSDLAIVCANCHRMLHQRRNLRVEDLKVIVNNRRADQPQPT